MELAEYEDRVVAIIREALEPYPADAATVELVREGGAFDLQIEITPLNPGAASIAGGIETVDEFNFTFGNIWLEYWETRQETTEEVLEFLRSALDATFAGRLFERGTRSDAYGWFVREDGTKESFGAIGAWLNPIAWARGARQYESYGERRAAEAWVPAAGTQSGQDETMTQTGERTGIQLETYVMGRLKESKAKAIVVIDGVKTRVPFGTSFIPMSPGIHALTVYWGLQFPSARRSLEVSINDGTVTNLRWDTPTFIWQRGQLQIVEA